MTAPLKKRSAIGVSVTGSRKWPLLTDAPCYSRCGTLKNPHCSMAISVEQRSKFAALHRQLWRLHMSEKFSSGTKKTKQTNKHSTVYWVFFIFITSVSIKNAYFPTAVKRFYAFLKFLFKQFNFRLQRKPVKFHVALLKFWERFFERSCRRRQLTPS